MEVKLTIDSSQIGDTVVELFKNISQEKKEAMALEIMSKWLNEPYQVERQVAEKNILIELRQTDKYTGWSNDKKYYKDMNDEELRQTSEYRDKLRSFKSSKELMIESVATEAVNFYRTKTSEMVESNEQLKVVFKQVSDKIQEDFPKFVHDAMVYWFTQQLSTTMSMASTAMMQSSNTGTVLKDLKDKLGIPQY